MVSRTDQQSNRATQSFTSLFTMNAVNSRLRIEAGNVIDTHEHAGDFKIAFGALPTGGPRSSDALDAYGTVILRISPNPEVADQANVGNIKCPSGPNVMPVGKNSPEAILCLMAPWINSYHFAVKGVGHRALCSSPIRTFGLFHQDHAENGGESFAKTLPDHLV